MCEKRGVVWVCGSTESLQEVVVETGAVSGLWTTEDHV